MCYSSVENKSIKVFPEELDIEEAKERGFWSPLCPFCSKKVIVTLTADRSLCPNCSRSFSLEPILSGIT